MATIDRNTFSSRLTSYYSAARRLLNNLSTLGKESFLGILDGFGVSIFPYTENLKEKEPELLNIIEVSFTNPTFKFPGGVENIRKYNTALVSDDITITSTLTEDLLSSLSPTIRTLDFLSRKYSTYIQQTRNTNADWLANLETTYLFPFSTIGQSEANFNLSFILKAGLLVLGDINFTDVVTYLESLKTNFDNLSSSFQNLETNILADYNSYKNNSTTESNTIEETQADVSDSLTPELIPTNLGEVPDLFDTSSSRRSTSRTASRQEDKEINNPTVPGESWGIRFSYETETSMLSSDRTTIQKEGEDVSNEASTSNTNQINKVVRATNNYYLNLLPAIRSNVGLQGATDVPGAQPGLNFNFKTNVVKQKIPGYQPVYQSLGVDTLQCTLVGSFTGADGPDVANVSKSLLPFKGNNSDIDFLSPQSTFRFEDLITKFDSYKSYQVFLNTIVVPNREVTIEINIGRYEQQVSADDQGFLRSTNGNPTFTGIVKNISAFYVRYDRTWYIMDIDITDAGLISKKCLNLTNAITEAVDPKDLDDLITITEDTESTECRTKLEEELSGIEVGGLQSIFRKNWRAYPIGNGGREVLLIHEKDGWAVTVTVNQIVDPNNSTKLIKVFKLKDILTRRQTIDIVRTRVTGSFGGSILDAITPNNTAQKLMSDLIYEYTKDAINPDTGVRYTFRSNKRLVDTTGNPDEPNLVELNFRNKNRKWFFDRDNGGVIRVLLNTRDSFLALSSTLYPRGVRATTETIRNGITGDTETKNALNIYWNELIQNGFANSGTITTLDGETLTLDVDQSLCSIPNASSQEVLNSSITSSSADTLSEANKILSNSLLGNPLLSTAKLFNDYINFNAGAANATVPINNSAVELSPNVQLTVSEWADSLDSTVKRILIQELPNASTPEQRQDLIQRVSQAVLDTNGELDIQKFASSFDQLINSDVDRNLVGALTDKGQTQAINAAERAVQELLSDNFDSIYSNNFTINPSGFSDNFAFVEEFTEVINKADIEEVTNQNLDNVILGTTSTSTSTGTNVPDEILGSINNTGTKIVRESSKQVIDTSGESILDPNVADTFTRYVASQISQNYSEYRNLSNNGINANAKLWVEANWNNIITGFQQANPNALLPNEIVNNSFANRLMQKHIDNIPTSTSVTGIQSSREVFDFTAWQRAMIDVTEDTVTVKSC